eukprot:TRINITY_DN10251_c0_g1_i2.p1 TRINITY_DN10251_c0_g1~~TRINITY_DN10251_c0_g1_i2.p1  ORF type:complete len:150 (-),score=19.49 TRINITY_DN10251_c0_g1_i2:227-676(-)
MISFVFDCKFSRKYPFQSGLSCEHKNCSWILLKQVRYLLFLALLIIHLLAAMFQLKLVSKYTSDMLHIRRLYLHEATIRLMAGASPGKTQLLLDRSAATKTNRRGLMCGKEREVYSGEREHAMALVMACRHLPTQLMASPGERSGQRNV